ncbi:MBL fold metallo-hydrolase [Mesobacterium pallidum]|uniref:MBL fold metallo-hydrolase n=1 Tax=Mesobacterium pallidum TaxID=2872037 RepID=UPI001EE178EE|nr:MBL fold metallo-hydrolase [Mesobacterium pallidum]
MFTRRQFMAASAAATALPGRLWSATSLTAGETEILTLSDGHLVMPEALIYGDRDPAATRTLIAEMGGMNGGLQPPCNLTLLRRGSDVVLFDAGAGTGFMPTAGELPDALDAVGLAPSDITHVIFTHGHPDHLWGVLDDFDDPLFAEAQHYMGGQELAYWSDPATADSIGAERQAFAAGAIRRLGILEGMVEAFADGDAVLPGITAVATPGHTPGHMSFAIETEAGPVMVVGDAVVNDHLALADPGAEAPNDQDPATAAATRLALLDRIASEDATVIGFHMGHGGMGKLARDGNGYRFRP